MNFRLIADNFNIAPLRERLQKNPELFGLYDFRGTAYDSPHTKMRDIWVRYNDVLPFLEKGDMAGFADEHEPVWYPVATQMPEVFPIVTELMERVQAKRLGGVLITKVPPGGGIDPHVDRGWHAEYYDKYYVPILNSPGATFNFPDGAIAPNDGEVYWFRNDVPHWVINDSQTDRIAMIVCIEPNDRFSNEHRNRPVQRTGGDLRG
jgi:hypothetical protein